MAAVVKSYLKRAEKERKYEVNKQLSTVQNTVQWNLDLVTDLVTQKSVTKSWVVTKSMYFMY